MWTLKMQFALLTSMLESVRNGLRVQSGFKKETWKITGKVLKHYSRLNARSLLISSK